MKDDEENDKENLVIQKSDNENEWALLLVFTDRVFMAIYIGSVLVLVIYFLSHMNYTDSTILNEGDVDSHITFSDDND